MVREIVGFGCGEQITKTKGLVVKAGTNGRIFESNEHYALGICLGMPT